MLYICVVGCLVGCRAWYSSDGTLAFQDDLFIPPLSREETDNTDDTDDTDYTDDTDHTDSFWWLAELFWDKRWKSRRRCLDKFALGWCQGKIV